MKKSQNESQPPARTSESRQSDMRELAAAMNNLANALRETNALAAQAKAEDPNWQKIPSLLTDLNRQLRMIAGRL